MLQPGDAAEQRSFATARGAEQRSYTTTGQPQINIQREVNALKLEFKLKAHLTGCFALSGAIGAVLAAQ